MADEGTRGGGADEEGLLLAFDVDCGEVVTGRHLHLRGLQDDGRWPDEPGSRPDGVHGSWQLVSLVWELLPAVREDDLDAGKWYQHDVAEVRYGVDPPLDWDLSTAGGLGGGTVDTRPGQLRSRGTYGPYPLPADARRVSFEVLPYLDRRPGDATDRGGPSSVVTGSRHPVGRLLVDLPSGPARWERPAGR